jgi:hypothetical protein
MGPTLDESDSCNPSAALLKMKLDQIQYYKSNADWFMSDHKMTIDIPHLRNLNASNKLHLTSSRLFSLISIQMDLLGLECNEIQSDCNHIFWRFA